MLASFGHPVVSQHSALPSSGHRAVQLVMVVSTQVYLSVLSRCRRWDIGHSSVLAQQDGFLGVGEISTSIRGKGTHLPGDNGSNLGGVAWAFLIFSFRFWVCSEWVFSSF